MDCKTDVFCRLRESVNDRPVEPVVADFTCRGNTLVGFPFGPTLPLGIPWENLILDCASPSPRGCISVIVLSISVDSLLSLPTKKDSVIVRLDSVTVRCESLTTLPLNRDTK